ncbi:MAG: acyl carrier protein [Planctomycetes bacterium]|nr:acyl carrier protein [Planctomycetota bacterium]
MVTASEVVETITALLVEVGEVDPATITPRSQLADLGLDSVEVMEVVSQVEDRYDVTLSEDQLGRVSTVRELARCVERLLKE